jgi:hypothetical protein
MEVSSTSEGYRAVMDGIRLDFRYDRWCGWMLGLLGMGRRHSHVTMNDDAIRVTMGWAFRSEFPRSSVTSAAPAQGPVYGWGVHGWRGRWLVNGSSKGLVKLQLDPGARARVCGVPIHLTQLTLSLVDPDVLLA